MQNRNHILGLTNKHVLFLLNFYNAKIPLKILHVRERERERERQTDSQRDREREGDDFSAS